MIISVFAGLLVTWLGPNDWRFPWIANPEGPKAQSTSPVNAMILEDGGVDLSWTAVDDDLLDHYSVIVTAVAPISYSYGVPFYPGVAPTNERIYPERELNENLEAEGRMERVAPGQTWHVCVTGMMATPNGVDVAPYTLAETQACSDDFILP